MSLMLLSKLKITSIQYFLIKLYTLDCENIRPALDVADILSLVCMRNQYKKFKTITFTKCNWSYPVSVYILERKTLYYIYIRGMFHISTEII